MKVKCIQEVSPHQNHQISFCLVMLFSFLQIWMQISNLAQLFINFIILSLFILLQLLHQASLIALLVKNPPAMQEDPLEKGKATHSSILAWRIPRGCKKPITCHGLRKTKLVFKSQMYETVESYEQTHLDTFFKYYYCSSSQETKPCKFFNLGTVSGCLLRIVLAQHRYTLLAYRTCAL